MTHQFDRTRAGESVDDQITVRKRIGGNTIPMPDRPTNIGNLQGAALFLARKKAVQVIKPSRHDPTRRVRQAEGVPQLMHH